MDSCSADEHMNNLGQYRAIRWQQDAIWTGATWQLACKYTMTNAHVMEANLLLREIIPQPGFSGTPRQQTPTSRWEENICDQSTEYLWLVAFSPNYERWPDIFNIHFPLLRGGAGSHHGAVPLESQTGGETQMVSSYLLSLPKHHLERHPLEFSFLSLGSTWWRRTYLCFQLEGRECLCESYGDYWTIHKISVQENYVYLFVIIILLLD